MTDVLKMSRKALTIGVVLTTILWSMMASVLVAPLKASAAGCTSGALIKGSLSAVYYCGSDGKRYVFPNEKTYFTWYTDFSAVMTISDADLANIMIGGNVTYRPGVKLVKIQSDPKVYAVSHGGVLHWVTTEALAVCLYGADWNTNDTHDIPDVFFTNYSISSPILGCSDYNATAEMSSSQSINQDKNLGSGATSGLTASLASDTPAAQTLPKGANAVNFVKFNVSNGTGSALTVDTVTIRRVGAGSPSDFGNVYLYEGNTRLTTGRTVNSSSNEVTFNSLGLSMTSGQTRSLWVAATISASALAGNVNAFQVTHVLSGTANAVGLPIQGNNMTIAGASVGSIGVDMSGSLTNPKVGQLQAKIGEFRLTASSVEDMDVKRVTLFQGGSLSRANLTNLKLKQSGSEVAAASSVDEDDRITFVFLNASLLEKGNSRTYEVWGDIGPGARVNETIDLFVEEDVDVWAIGRTYGQGVQVCRSGSATAPCSASDDYDGSAGDGSDSSKTTVEGGQVTLTFNGPASHDIATNSKDQEVFNFTITSQANVEVRNLRMRLAATGDGLISASTSANYTDFKVNDQATGVTVAGPKDVSTTGSDTSQDFVFTDTFTLNANTSRTFKVTLDVANNASLDGSTVTASLLPFQASDIRNLDNSTYVAVGDIVPSSTISGNAMTIRTPALTLSSASTPVSQTYIKGSQNVDLAGISLKAGDAADMRVTAITVQSRVESATSTDTPSNGCDTAGAQPADEVKLITDILLSAKLMNGAAQVGDLESPSSPPAGCTSNTGGLLAFTNLNVLVPKGQTITLNLLGNLSSSIANLPDYIDFTVAASAVTAQDPEGNSVTATGSADSNTMTISDNGSMTYALAPDDTESEAGLVIGGTTAVLAKYRFTAANEELKLTKVRMALPNGSATAVQSLWLYDGATLVAGPVAPNSLGASDFSGFNFVVPKDGSKTLTVKGMLNTVGSGGAASGLDLTVTICDGVGSDCNSTGAEAGTYEVRGTSAGSSTVDTSGNSDDIAAREKRIRKTKPTLSLAALPTSTLSNGTQVLSRFTVTADSAQQVSMKTVTFELNLNIAAVSLVGSDSHIREVGGASNISGTTTLSGTCGGTGTCTAKSTFATEQSVTAGTSKTYELRLNVTGAASGASISTKLLGDSAQVTGELDGAVNGRIDDLDNDPAPAIYNFVWSDNSAIPHNDVGDTNGDGADDAAASNDWTNGRFVRILPSDTQTMSF